MADHVSSARAGLASLRDNVSVIAHQHRLQQYGLEQLERVRCERQLVQKAIGELRTLISSESYVQNVRLLESVDAEMRGAQDQVVQLLDEASCVKIDTPARAIREYEQLWSQRVVGMMTEQKQREIRALRVQGRRFVAKEPIIIRKSGDLFSDTILLLADEINRTVGNPESNLSGLERFFVPEPPNTGAIWLYHHAADASRKHECLFFRIDVSSSANEDILILLEIYAPLGFGCDPAQYPLATSNLFCWPEWITTRIATTTYGATNTVNLNTNNSSSHGTTIGRTLSVSESDSLALGTNSSDAESVGESLTRTESANYGDAYARDHYELFGYDTRTMSNGFGSSLSEGTSMTRTRTEGSSETRTQQRGKSTSDSVNDAVTTTTGTSKGISVARNNGLQFSALAGGVDYSTDPERMLKLYTDANPDAGRIILRVQQLVEAAAMKVQTQVQTRAARACILQDRRPWNERCFEIGSRMPIEVEFLRTPRLDRTASGARGKKELVAIPQTSIDSEPKVPNVQLPADSLQQVSLPPLQPPLRQSPSDHKPT